MSEHFASGLTSEEGMTLLTTSIPANFSTVAAYGARNNTNGHDCLQVESKDWIITVVPVYILLITVLGIVFNVFVLMVFCLHKKACTVAEIYLSNLAAADLVVLACLPFWAVNVYHRYDWPFGQFLCKVVNLGINMNIYCSIYFLILISIDRYVALVHTMSYNRMRRPKYAKLGCLLVWGWGLLLGVPTLIYRVVKPDCNSNSCYFDYPRNTELPFEVMITTITFIIPISIIFYCTLKIIQTLNNRSIEGLNVQNTEHKATTLVLAVLLAFMICWVPFRVLRIVEVFIRAELLTADFTVLDTCLHIFTYLAFSNSVLNPILYVIVGKNFRKKVKELFRPKSRRQTFNIASTSSNQTRSIRLMHVSR